MTQWTESFIHTDWFIYNNKPGLSGCAVNACQEPFCWISDEEAAQWVFVTSWILDLVVRHCSYHSHNYRCHQSTVTKKKKINLNFYFRFWWRCSRKIIHSPIFNTRLHSSTQELKGKWWLHKIKCYQHFQMASYILQACSSHISWRVNLQINNHFRTTHAILTPQNYGAEGWIASLTCTTGTNVENSFRRTYLKITSI